MNWDKIENNMNEKQDGAIETSDERTSESKKPHFTVPYAPSVKYIIEKYGLGDAEDFQRRINAINKFIDNKEAHFNSYRVNPHQKTKPTQHS